MDGGISGSEAAEANRVRETLFGDGVHIRGIIEISNACSRNCTYCGLRRDNRRLPRYSMTEREILDTVSRAAGAGTVVLQSGENDGERPDRIAGIVSAIKARHDVAVTLSLGVKPRSFYRACREAGADRYLLKHEAAVRTLYERFHPDSRLEERVASLRGLRSLGYQIGTGNIVGLPCQTAGDRAADIRLALALDVDMASFGPFVPDPATPLANARAGSLKAALRMVSAARTALGPVHIPATTAFDAIAEDGRLRALRAGANVIMPNLTPERYRNLYRLYPRRHAADGMERVRDIITRAGRHVAAGRGDSLKAKPCEAVS